MNVRYITTLKEKYGPLLGCRTGSANYVICQDGEVATELFLKHGLRALGRNDDPYSGVMSGRVQSADGVATGLIFAQGDRWRENRKFALMKVFGQDRIPKLQEKMSEEITAWLNWLDDLIAPSGKTTIAPNTVASALTMNVIGSIVCDVRPNSMYGNSNIDPDMTTLGQGILSVLSVANAGVYALANVLIPPLRNYDKFGFPQWKKSALDTRALLQRIVERREQEINQVGVPENPTILDMLAHSRLQDPEFAAVETSDIVGILLGTLQISTPY